MPVLIVIDSFAWISAFFVASFIRHGTWALSDVTHLSQAGDAIPLRGVLALGISAAILHTLLAWLVRLHQGRAGVGSFEELFLLASVMIVVGATITTLNALAPSAYAARTTPVIATCFALIAAAWPRALWRLMVSDARPNTFGFVTTNVLIVGAGDGGRQLIASMLRDPKHTWNPVGMVDDDKRRRHLRFRGVRVVGTTDKLATVAHRLGVSTIVIAIPSASSGTVARIYGLARGADLDVKILPSVDELLGGVDFTDVRDISPADFLGRIEISTDVSTIAGYLRGKRVLVTGAGGSIGSELCRQISAFGPAELMMLDRDESALHSLLLSMNGRADLESPDVILADIRDGRRIREIFEARRPQVIFHSAALKHVNLLEVQAAEAVKTNVLGTLNVLEAARRVGVERFVNISTDKAAAPENVLGYSKCIAEGLTAGVAARSAGTYLSVRFGNVLGTRGSVLETFASQIKSGGPVTVTDPEVTRFFMTIHESVQLVIQAAAIGRDGEALVLDMGEPVKIDDVARQMIDQSRRPIKIVYTGLKSGEKLHEVLFGEEEVDYRPIHPLVSHVPVPPITQEEVMLLSTGGDNHGVVSDMREMSERMRLLTLDEVRT
ncbi:polysaccharide biosynthesis protein [Aeromicrobium sp.]